MKNSDFNIIKRLVLQARPFWPHIIGFFILILLSTPIALLKPLGLKILIDSGFGSEPLPHFIRVFFSTDYRFTFQTIIIISAAFVIVMALIDALYSALYGLLDTYTGEKLILNFRALVFNRLQRISLAYHDRKGTSDALYRVQWDTVAIRTLLMGSIPSLISSFVTLASMIFVMFQINKSFAFIAICVIPPLFFLTRYSRKVIKRGWRKIKQDESIALGVLNEVISSLRVVKAFGQEDSEERRFAGQANNVIKGQVKMAKFGSLFNSLVGILFAIGTASFIYFGATYVHQGQMTLGELTLVLAYLSQVFTPLQAIAKNINSIQSAILSVERVFELLDQEKEVEESPDSIHLPRAKGAFEFQNVSFSYEEDRAILQNVSFKIKAGDRVGIMGSTGAGKTTLFSLLIRFYDTACGKILIDDSDIKNFKLADYRNQFSIVLQEPVLFSTTIAENIRYGRPGATEKEIIEAAKAANAHEFITKSKDGYNTMVGERGMKLSGGERQRISIARAFIKNAPVLILDEPTSSLDVRTEAQVMVAMERLMEGRTTFMITHRLDSLSSCNVIVHLENGKLVDFVRDHDVNFLTHKKSAFINYT
ncbi:MAG: ABC transporter ATP-binding protein/permease [Bacteroidota bacterium]|nr:ABC transporter ATP-binding protein/permease [Bacteroidota bacterium]